MKNKAIIFAVAVVIGLITYYVAIKPKPQANV